MDLFNEPLSRVVVECVPPLPLSATKFRVLTALLLAAEERMKALQRRKAKVLVVDDIALNRLLLSNMIGKLGFNVLEAADGLECLELFSQERHELCCVFLDLNMPRLNGWDTANLIRTLECESQSTRTPIVVCTATCMDEDGAYDRAFASGVDACVGKPLSLESVCKLLQQHVPSFRDSHPEYCLSQDA